MIQDTLRKLRETYHILAGNCLVVHMAAVVGSSKHSLVDSCLEGPIAGKIPEVERHLDTRLETRSDGSYSLRSHSRNLGTEVVLRANQVEAKMAAYMTLLDFRPHLPLIQDLDS